MLRSLPLRDALIAVGYLIQALGASGSLGDVLLRFFCRELRPSIAIACHVVPCRLSDLAKALGVPAADRYADGLPVQISFEVFTAGPKLPNT